MIGLDDNSTKVLLALVGLVPSTLAAIFAYLIRRDVRTPSGAKIGRIAEETHAISHANTALTLGIHDAVGAKTPTRKTVDENIRGDIQS